MVARSHSALGDRGNTYGSAPSSSASWGCLIDKKTGEKTMLKTTINPELVFNSMVILK